MAIQYIGIAGFRLAGDRFKVRDTGSAHRPKWLSLDEADESAWLGFDKGRRVSSVEPIEFLHGLAVP